MSGGGETNPQHETRPTLSQERVGNTVIRVQKHSRNDKGLEEVGVGRIR